MHLAGAGATKAGLPRSTERTATSMFSSNMQKQRCHDYARRQRGHNGLPERQALFDKIKKEWGLT